MKNTSLAISVLDEVTNWPGISTQLTPRGSTAIRVRRSRAWPPPPRPRHTRHASRDDRRAEVLNAGRAREWFSGWGSKPLNDDADAQDGIVLLRASYDELHTR